MRLRNILLIASALTGAVTPSSLIGPPFQLSLRKNILISTGLSLRISECRLPDAKR